MIVFPSTWPKWILFLDIQKIFYPPSHDSSFRSRPWKVSKIDSNSLKLSIKVNAKVKRTKVHCMSVWDCVYVSAKKKCVYIYIQIDIDMIDISQFLCNCCLCRSKLCLLPGLSVSFGRMNFREAMCHAKTWWTVASSLWDRGIEGWWEGRSAWKNRNRSSSGAGLRTESNGGEKFIPTCTTVGDKFTRSHSHTVDRWNPANHLGYIKKHRK